jgi:hypothetical protein
VSDTAWIGRLVIAIGIAVVVFGLLILLLSKLNIKGHPLPGDIYIVRGNTRIYIPIVTGLVISIIVTLIQWIYSALRR